MVGMGKISIQSTLNEASYIKQDTGVKIKSCFNFIKPTREPEINNRMNTKKAGATVRKKHV